MRLFRWLVLPVALSLPFPVQANTTGVDSVKNYLIVTVEKMKAASEAFKKNAAEYEAIIQANGGDYAKAQATDGAKLKTLIGKMQENYKAIDSFGYETVEGIVAGVDSLASYDIYLDAGVPEGEGAPDEVAGVVLTLSNGEKIDRKGSLFTYIIEPTLWLTADSYVVAGPQGKLPKAEVLMAAASDADQQIGKLLADSRAWQPSNRDCFGALILMTPTLSDYFEDWKESRYSDQKSGRFNAVSRVSDMRGIMTSCSVMYDAVNQPVSVKDEALSRAVLGGFREILAFLDKIEAREAAGEIKAAEVDEMAVQAKAKTDKLVPQIEQAAALVDAKPE